jgi:hypothetical protein
MGERPCTDSRPDHRSGRSRIVGETRRRKKEKKRRRRRRGE